MNSIPSVADVIAKRRELASDPALTGHTFGLTRHTQDLVTVAGAQLTKLDAHNRSEIQRVLWAAQELRRELPDDVADGLVLGLWKLSNGLVSFDLNVQIPTRHRDRTVAVAREILRQEALWDVNKAEAVPVGGDGQTPELSAPVLAVLVAGLLSE